METNRDITNNSEVTSLIKNPNKKPIINKIIVNKKKETIIKTNLENENSVINPNKLLKVEGVNYDK